MAITRKRKHGGTDDTVHVQSQTSIKLFGNISKTPLPRAEAKKHKSTHEKVLEPMDTNIITLPPKLEHKRKRNTLSNDEQELERQAALARSRPFKQFAKQTDIETTPEAKRFKDVFPASPSETPSKRAMAMLNRLSLDKSKAISFNIQPNTSSYDTPPRTPEVDESLPDELQDFEKLYAAFVSALSLCYAHGGSSTSTELHTLLPAVTKSWKKRAVDLEDLRRLLSLDTDNFVLEYCGQAGVRLTIAQNRGQQFTRGGGLIDVEGLKTRFCNALKEKWYTWICLHQAGDRQPALFLEQLTLAEVRKNEAAQAAMPFLKRGQRRLADLRESQASAAVAADGKLKSSQVNAQGKTTQAIQSRGSNLLDRVLARQAANTDLPSGPTAQQQQRNAALHRVEDVTRVLNMLAGNKSRSSFSMQSITQHLQQSLRNPISRDEVNRCLILMSQDIAPGFVSVVQTGAVQGVVVSRAGRVALEELRRRVASALS